MNREKRNSGILIVLSSPSGAGKTSIAKELIRMDNRIKFSISVTTRPPRRNEKDGKEYFFKSEDQFDEYVKNESLLEYANVFGYRYGTLLDQIELKLKDGFDLLFDVDWQGGEQLKKSIFKKNLISIFILPPSLKELEARLSKRGQDKEEIIKKRMMLSFAEISHWDNYDYVLINKNLAETVYNLKKIIFVERLKRNNKYSIEDLVRELENEFNDLRKKNDYKI